MVSPEDKNGSHSGAVGKSARKFDLNQEKESQSQASPSPFEQESEKLKASWMRHDEQFLRDYLVSSVQDPRINPQSILARHTIINQISDTDFSKIQMNELLFSAIAQWFYSHCDDISDSYFRDAFLYALEKSAENVEGIIIPQFIRNAFQILPLAIGDIAIPNYIRLFLTEHIGRNSSLSDVALDTFVQIWKNILTKTRAISLLEPACGSANDFRVIYSMGLHNSLEYTGFDICEKNISNAKSMFPEIQFFVDDVYRYETTKAYDIIMVHDLFEHLSGVDFVLAKFCKLCKGSLILSFFNMALIDEHIITPYEDYYWNRLSVQKISSLLQESGFNPQIIHINTMFKELFDADNLYNPNGYLIIGRKI